MRSYEAMILDGGMVTNVIAAPQCYVVANSDEWLNGVVFENEAVFADFVAGRLEAELDAVAV